MRLCRPMCGKAPPDRHAAQNLRGTARFGAKPYSVYLPATEGQALPHIKRRSRIARRTPHQNNLPC
jgi:hypothetical protein